MSVKQTNPISEVGLYEYPVDSLHPAIKPGYCCARLVTTEKYDETRIHIELPVYTHGNAQTFWTYVRKMYYDAMKASGAVNEPMPQKTTWYRRRNVRYWKTVVSDVVEPSPDSRQSGRGCSSGSRMEIDESLDHTVAVVGAPSPNAACDVVDC